MPLIDIVRETPIERTARVQQIEGVFDIKSSAVSREKWTANLPIHEKEWNVGLIVGASGSGKSTIAKEVFGDALRESFSWEKG